MEMYWHILGSAIQIQAVVRGWQQAGLYHKQRDGVPTLQRAVRCFLARQELSRRKFILKVVSSVNSRKSPKEKKRSKDETEWTMIEQERKMIDCAARTIQRFFRMVKMEVDRAIRAERRRRRKNGKHKDKRKKKMFSDLEEEDLLENVWQTTVHNNNNNNVSDSLQASKGDGYLSTSNRNPSQVKSSSCRRKLKDGSEGFSFETSDYKRKPRPRKDDTVMMTSRRNWNDDTASVASYWSTTSSHARVPKSRIALSEKDIDEDFALETAFSEINLAKGAKRLNNPSTMKSSAPRSGSAGSKTRLSARPPPSGSGKAISSRSTNRDRTGETR